MATFPALAIRLRRLRQRHALTQEVFAETIGLSYKFYQQIEAGRKKQIWLETVERLAAGFGLQAWQLLAPDEPTHTIVHRRTCNEVPVKPEAVAEPAAPYQVRSARKKHQSKRSSRKIP